MSGLFYSRNKTIFIIMASIFFQNNYAASGFDQIKTNQTSKQQDNFDRAQVWYENLRDSYCDTDFSSPDIQVYYKNIDITSRPKNTENSWFIALVTNLGKPIRKESDGTYRCGDSSFGINIPENYDTTANVNQSLAFVHNDDTGIECSLIDDKKEACFPCFTNARDLSHDKFILGAFLQRKVKYQAIVNHPNHTTDVIDIECKNRRHYPIKVAGSAILYDKITEKTSVFFDFVDLEGGIVDYVKPVFTCKHNKQAPDNNKIVYVREHQLFACQAQDIICFFDSPAHHAAWMPETTGFYDLKKQRVVSGVPGCYRDPSNCSGIPCEPRIWIFGNDEDHNSFYTLHTSTTFSDTNDYVYSPHDGTLRATLQFKHKVYEYGTPNDNITLSGLLTVMKPSLKMHDDITFSGGPRSWPEGMYKRIQSEDKIIWQRAESYQPTEIEQIVLSDQAGLNLNSGIVIHAWPQEAMTAQESNDWCHAAQGFFYHFTTKIDHCNQLLLHKLAMRDKLTKLQISRLHIDDKTITMPAVLTAISSLKQLTELDFSHNSPIVDFNEDYNQLADRSSALFVAVGTCVSQLKKLQKLRLQGLWLKPQALLGAGVDQYGVSKEVAILAGVINHKNGKGVHAIINAVSKLPALQDISIDSIPCHGSSFANRWQGNGYYSWSPILPFAYYDRVKQEANLKKLAKDSAQSLAKNSSLQTIRVYSPGSKIVEYFSKEFKEELIQSSRPDRAQKLVLTSSTLE